MNPRRKLNSSLEYQTLGVFDKKNVINFSVCVVVLFTENEKLYK